MLNLKSAGVFDSSKIFKNKEQTPERIVKHYEIELYVYGKGQSVIDGVVYEHQKGNLLFCTPGQKRYSRQCFVCYHVHLHMDPQAAAFFSHMATVTKVTDFERYEQIYIEIIRLYESQNKDSQLMLQSKLYELLDMVYRDSKLDSVIAPNTIKMAIEYMEKHFQKRILLKDIANHVNLSPTYFHKLFKSATHVTPQQYLMDLRLSNAKNMLLTKNNTIEEISEICGFSSISYFDYSFKKAYDISPMAFRKRKYMP